MMFSRCPPLVQRIARPAFTVTWAGVNLKLEMSTSVASCGAGGGRPRRGRPGGHTEGPVLEHLGVAHADAHIPGGLFDAEGVEEPQLEDAAVSLGEGIQEPPGPGRGIGMG